ncbi:Ulp1 protease family, carboxy-terminal domain protein [Arachis hypogaea]|nr:Ulp1 protease family, carboxy-terminal domain protein [Arachis hypogaea]
MAARGKRRSTQKIEKGDDEAKNEQSRKISRKVVDKEVIELSSSLRGSTMHDQRLHVNFNGGASKEIGDDFGKTTVVEPSLKEVVTQMSTMMNTLTNLIASQTKTCYPVFGTMPQTINLRNGPADNFNPTLMPVIMSGFSMPSGSLERNLDSSKKIRSNMSSIHQAADSKSHMATKCCSMSPKCKQTPPDDYVIRRSLFTDDGTGKKTATEPVITSSLDKAVYVSYFNPADRKLPLANETAKILAWKPVLFRPPADMALCKDEVSVVTYVFGSDMEDEELNSEIISQTNLWHANRRVMYTLLPNKPLVDEIINLTSSMLMCDARKDTGFPCLWFLPTTFSQFALNWTHSPKTLKRYYAEEYMGEFESLCKIFVPMNEDNMHWNDCGVWVTTWMRECQWRSNYNIKVNDSTRLRLAIDLVMNLFNLKSQEVLEAAKIYYNEISKKEERLVKGLGSML